MTTTEAVYERMFGTRTGFHTHPATHPQWMTFPDTGCPVCEPATGAAACDSTRKVA